MGENSKRNQVWGIYYLLGFRDGYTWIKFWVGLGLPYLNPNPIHGYPCPRKPENLLFLETFYWENDKTINVISFLYIPIK